MPVLVEIGCCNRPICSAGTTQSPTGSIVSVSHFGQSFLSSLTYKRTNWARKSLQLYTQRLEAIISGIAVRWVHLILAPKILADFQEPEEAHRNPQGTGKEQLESRAVVFTELTQFC
jgi:hypothetical protein